MTVKETLNDGLKRGYEIKITAAELDVKVLEKLKEAQPEVEMKGFRKGKVPMAMMKKQFGPKVLGEAMQEAVDGAMNTHLDTSGDRPAMQPEMKMANDEWKEGDDVVVNVSYEALPVVPDLDFSQIKLDKLIVKADDLSVQEALTSLADTAKNFEDRTTGSKAEDGDQVIFDFLGKVDGEPFEGGAAEGHALELGSGQFIPGFEEGLVGVKSGDDKKVEVTFPADYNAEHLAGKVAVFECKILNVKEPKTSEIDDEMAKQFGAEDLAGLKGQITSKLEEEYSGAARAVTKRALLDELDKMVSFELPPSLVEAEAGQIAHQLWHEDNPEVEGHDHPEIETTEEHTKLADRRVKLGLLLAEIGQKAEIQVTDAEFTQAVMNQARQYGDQARQFFEFVQKNPQMQQQIRAPLFEDKVVDHIVDVASMTEKEVSKDDLQKAVEALEEE